MSNCVHDMVKQARIGMGGVRSSFPSVCVSTLSLKFIGACWSA